MNGDLTSSSGEYGLSLLCGSRLWGSKRGSVGNDWLRERSVGRGIGGGMVVWGRGGWAIVVDLSAVCVHTAESPCERGETGETGHGGCLFFTECGRDEMIQDVFKMLPTTRERTFLDKIRKIQQEIFSTLKFLLECLLHKPHYA